MSRTNRIANVVAIAGVALAVAALALPASAAPVDRWEGGYVGSKTEGDATTPVWNFIKHFSYEQYYWAEPFQFSSYNDQRVDKMDFSYFVGHGDRWKIKCQANWLDLRTAGSTSHDGWGDVNSEFVTIHACQVIASPIEVADWYTPWTNADGVFDGVHQVTGFRTNASMSCDQDISNYFGSRIKAGGKVWQSWFDAIWLYGDGTERGAAVMYPPCENDSYGSFASDPPPDHTWLKIWWQY